jgi:3-hydroxyacyl-CoA dehydrogenase
MYLVELITTPTTDAHILDDLETFVTTALGKGVVRAKDTPNFIANRVGIAGMLATMKEAETFGLSYDVVDDLTGKKLGRASSGTFRTADVVGLDTMAHVIKTLQDNLKDDPFYGSYATPPVLAKLIEQGALGQKSGAGFYKKVGKDIQRLDPLTGNYVAGGGKADEIVARILKKAPAERLKLLRESKNPQAQFLWAILRDSFHYAAVHLADIAESARDVDFAMRWGFGVSQGPFELWQAAGWTQVAQWVKEDIAAGKTLSGAPLPAWVFDGPVAANGGVHHPEGSWSAAHSRWVAPSTLPVYQRQAFRETVFGSGAAAPLKSGTEEFTNDEVRVWTLDGEVLIASITAKLHLISPLVIEGLLKAVEVAEAKYKGLVIWSPDDVFSAGANLEALMPVFMKSGSKGILPEVKKLQDAMLRVRYASVPVVSAIRGIALGGGCEIALYSARRVAAMESYVGLVEVGVGLVPAGGGLTYIARRAAEMASAGNANADIFKFLSDGFTSAAMAKVGTSAIESRKLGYLLWSDVIVPNKDELLYVASQQAKALYESGYRAPAKTLFPVAGRNAIATIKAQLANMRDGGFISAHDFHISALIADVVCGGDVDAGSLVSEEYLMALERKHFCGLLDHEKTQERIMGMLQTGKPVRN